MPLESLSTTDLNDFSTLTEQESHSIEGQVEKMEMVEKMIHDRFDAHKNAVEQSLREQGLEGTALKEALENQVQRIDIRRMELGDGRFNLIVEKGEGTDDPPDPSLYRVMIPAHIDTLKTGAQTELGQDLRYPDRLTGLGTYDMGAAVLNNIALAAEVSVPRGMKTYFVFTVDEEKDSRGARHLIDQWDVWPHIDCVLSSEIGPLLPLPDGDPTMRLIAARAGRVKFLCNINVAPGSQGHGALQDLPNAGDALRELQNDQASRFYQGRRDQDSGIDEPRQMRQHPLLGEEKIEIGSFSASSTREGYVPTNRARMQYAVKMVPPSRIEEYSILFRRWADEVARRGRWADFGISKSLTLNTSVASYSPYEMPADHPLVIIAAQILERISGVAPEIVGAPSVADECDYAADMLRRQVLARPADSPAVPASFADSGKGILTIPVNGDNAHHPGEWVSKTDIMRVREALRLLIEDPEGLIRMHAARLADAAKKT